MSLSHYFVFLTCLYFSSSAIAQTTKINGRINFTDNEPVPGVLVFLQGNTKSAVSNESGNYVIENVPYGNYILETSSIEANKKTVAIKLNGTTKNINILIERATSVELSEVVVNVKTEKTKIETKGFAVNVIETKTAASRNMQTNELLSRTVGVRIRQNGGLGSDVNYNINGISGNSVRIFIDGIPISTYGSSFDLNSIPPSIIKRIEVYKGVVPGHLSDDALGGAINVVLKKGARNNFNASASYGSFNTSQVNFNGLYRFAASGFTLKTSFFNNYSDNDYEVWGKTVYNILPNGRYDYIKAKRLQDAFKSTGSVVEVGFTDVKWADNFFIGYTSSDSYKEVQHGTFMSTPYKGRFLRSDAGLMSLTYNKKDLFVKGLEFNFHGLYGERNRTINDTVKWNYDWNGNLSLDLNGQPIPRPSGAQQGAPTLANIKREVGAIRTGISYEINENHKFLLNYTLSNVNREDDDEMKSVLERKFIGTRDLSKNIGAFTYELTAHESRLKASVFSKYYQQKIERMNPIVQNINGVATRVEDIVSSNKNAIGYGGAFSYAVLPMVTLLTSAEKAVRLPTENEVFGDSGDNISENPNIKPETSKNYNLGFRFGKFKIQKHEIVLSTNGFIRSITDRIGTPVQTAINTNIQTLPFVNQGNVKSKGVDFELNYTYNNNLNIAMGVSKFELTTVTGGLKYDLPNEPFLNANVSAQYSFNDVLAKKSQLNLFYNFMFVDTFNYNRKLYSNTAGTDFFNVPEQFIQDAGVSYVFPKKNFIASFDAKNMFNKQSYDNMGVQKPGRAFYLKLNYIINNF
ncbi:TonB-dependent receptor [Flavobacterium hiemivividum]|uniref:TonB-dependent receptor n=1 Tax=Flavobacterium hiemivividum TaxID=2541734 RepID=A0A4R5CPM3_9FLAO|nr:TonB-dependent receptor [Flavobacterium hiemivividum]TDE01260.1 TonB-dependent receptor [Flavobacterium hiemivividum]